MSIVTRTTSHVVRLFRNIEPNPKKKRYSVKHLSMDSSRLSSTISNQLMSAFTIPDTFIDYLVGDTSAVKHVYPGLSLSTFQRTGS